MQNKIRKIILPVSHNYYHPAASDAIILPSELSYMYG